MCRRFHGEPVRRVIVSVPIDMVEAIDLLMLGQGFGKRHPANGCRSEFIRIAIAEKLIRDRNCDEPT
jgi:metal-responsive CopG/Arc/MetJ family transcriptional regulator